VRADEGMAQVIRSRLLSLMPAVAASVSPPGERSLDEQGVDPSELAKFGLDALNRRLAIIGVPLDLAAG